MIEQTGKVVAVEDGFAWVESERTSTCQSCSAKKGCGTSLLDNVFGQKRLAIKTLNTHNSKVGDHVVIGIREATLVKSSIVMYLIPLLTMFGLAALADQVLNGSELLTVVSGLTGLIAGFFWVKKYSEKVRYDEKYQPVILKVVNAGVHLDLGINK